MKGRAKAKKNQDEGLNCGSEEELDTSGDACAAENRFYHGIALPSTDC
jgi:hypothetical protein